MSGSAGRGAGSLHVMVEGATIRDDRTRRLSALAWVALIGTVVVVLSGDVVQATGSGAGCGESWPRCDGALLPGLEDSSTAIEFVHRALTLVLSGLPVTALIVAVWLWTPRGQGARRAAGLAGVFLVLEVAIGASLVAFGWVEDDASFGRVVADGLHVVNTFFLIGSLTLVAYRVAGGGSFARRGLGGDRRLLVGAGVLIAVAVTGAVNSLADTLFPADSVLEGVREEFGEAAPFLLRIRALHPVVAVIGGLAVLAIVRRVAADGVGEGQRRWIGRVYAAIGAQFAVGVLNIALLTPLEIQILHLLLAEALWISFLFFSFATLSGRVPTGPAQNENAAAVA